MPLSSSRAVSIESGLEARLHWVCLVCMALKICTRMLRGCGRRSPLPFPAQALAKACNEGLASRMHTVIDCFLDPKLADRLREWSDGLRFSSALHAKCSLPCKFSLQCFDVAIHRQASCTRRGWRSQAWGGAVRCFVLSFLKPAHVP